MFYLFISSIIRISTLLIKFEKFLEILLNETHRHYIFKATILQSYTAGADSQSPLNKVVKLYLNLYPKIMKWFIFLSKSISPASLTFERVVWKDKKSVSYCLSTVQYMIVGYNNNIRTQKNDKDKYTHFRLNGLPYEQWSLLNFSCSSPTFLCQWQKLGLKNKWSGCNDKTN